MRALLQWRPHLAMVPCLLVTERLSEGAGEQRGALESARWYSRGQWVLRDRAVKRHFMKSETDR